MLQVTIYPPPIVYTGHVEGERDGSRKKAVRFVWLLFRTQNKWCEEYLKFSTDKSLDKLAATDTSLGKYNTEPVHSLIFSAPSRQSQFLIMVRVSLHKNPPKVMCPLPKEARILDPELPPCQSMTYVSLKPCNLTQ